MEKKFVSDIRQEVIKDFEQSIDMEINLSDIEYITKTENEKRSPIFSMNEDQVLYFVENLSVEELSCLSVDELNRLGEVLGVEPGILGK